MSDQILAAIAVLLLPLFILPLALQPELGGPPTALGRSAVSFTVYEVRSGDTLSAIASRFDVPLSWVLATNDLATTTIYPGQRLVIPKGGVIHVVKAGETLSGIAADYGLDVGVLIQTNDLAAEPAVGERIFIPNPPKVPSLTTGAATFLWPLRGTISSPFGPRVHPIYGVPSFHTGIDIAVPEGTSVRAAAAGVVTTAGWDGGFGLLVVIDHGNGYQTYYGHLSKILVGAGERVEAAEVIALSGNTGLSTGPHLHFEVQYNGTSVDPRPLLP